MPNYNISVVVDPSGANSAINVVESNLGKLPAKAKQVETAIQRAFDFSAADTANGISAVDRAMDGMASSARAAGSAAQSAMDKAGASATQANERIVRSNAQVRASTLQLGQQFNDFATSVLSGGSVITAFAQQSGQAAFALQGMNGSLGTVGSFLAGPWGTILIVATTLLASFVSKLWDSEAASDAAEKSMAKFQQRQSDIGNFIDATTGKLKEQNRVLIQNAILTRQAKIDANLADIKSSSEGVFRRARNVASTSGLVAADGDLMNSNPDPAIMRVINSAGNNVEKLNEGLMRLRRSRPELRGSIDAINTSIAQTVLLTRENQKLNTEISQLNGNTDKQGRLTSSVVERQVAGATATTALGRAQARLNDVRARGAEIDRIDDPKQRGVALKQYEKDLTAATVAVNAASAAQKAGSKATSAHNKELAQQARIAGQVADFMSRLKDQGDALEKRGIEAAVQTQLGAFARQFNRNASKDEREQIESYIKRNQLLSDEKGILDSLFLPLETYQRQLAALDDLLKNNKINQDEYNQALSELPLVQKLKDVDQSLVGTVMQYDAQVKAIEDSIAKAIKVVDDAEKAGILRPDEAQSRREALRGPDGEDIVVNGGTSDNLRSRQINDLRRQRRDQLNSFDQSLGGQLGQDAEREALQNKYKDQLQQLRDFYGAQYALDADYQKRKKALDKKAAADEANYRATQHSLALSSASATFGSLAEMTATFAGEQSGVYKAMFAVSKAFAIADSIVKIQQGIANALSLPFPANIAAAAGVAAEAASIVSNIQSVALAFADGGMVHGPGTGRSDSIPAWLSDGEFVVNAQATKDNLPLLNAINKGQKVEGGGSKSSGSGDGALIIQTGDINVHGASGNPDEVGAAVKKAITGIVRSELKTQARPGGALTRVRGSAMSG